MQTIQNDRASSRASTQSRQIDPPRPSRPDSNGKSLDPSSKADLPDRDSRLRALLIRYPKIAHAEADELISLYQGTLPVERALLMSNKELAPNLEQFRGDHRRALRTPIRHYAVLIAIALSGLAATAYAILTGG